MMKIKIERPPVWDNITKAFKVEPRNALFTYGDTIYNPEDAFVGPDLMAHEEVHSEQQGETSPELWWGRYLREPAFRIDQEARAYGEQYRVFCHYRHDRNEQARMLHSIARALSGPLYDNAISQSDAMALVKQYSK